MNERVIDRSTSFTGWQSRGFVVLLGFLQVRIGSIHVVQCVMRRDLTLGCVHTRGVRDSSSSSGRSCTSGDPGSARRSWQHRRFLVDRSRVLACTSFRSSGYCFRSGHHVCHPDCSTFLRCSRTTIVTDVSGCDNGFSSDGCNHNIYRKFETVLCPRKR